MELKIQLNSPYSHSIHHASPKVKTGSKNSILAIILSFYNWLYSYFGRKYPFQRHCKLYIVPSIERQRQSAIFLLDKLEELTSVLLYV